jgi:hypothetical protein
MAHFNLKELAESCSGVHARIEDLGQACTFPKRMAHLAIFLN